MTPRPSTSRWTSLLRSRMGILLGIGGMAALVMGGVFAIATASPQTASASPTPSPTAVPSATDVASPTATPELTASPTPSPAPVVARCPLDGMPLDDGYELVEPALAVQIENHPAARPGRNLTNADVVIETTVEGDTTRFTGIYYCDPTVGMTGPVRSARYYSIDLWRDLHVLTVGFGASTGALQRFINAGMPYPNGIEGGWPWYKRYGPRAAPHNLYVDLEAMRAALSTHGRLMALAARVDELRPPWQFAEEPAMPAGARSVSRIDLRTTSSWRFAFTWNDRTSAYQRSDAGVNIVDEATGDPVAPASVVVQWVTQETVYGDPDPGGNPRRLHHLVGRGDGVLYTLGRAWDVRWERPAAESGTTWTFADSGEPVELPPGQVWWEILPRGSTLAES